LLRTLEYRTRIPVALAIRRLSVLKRPRIFPTVLVRFAKCAARMVSPMTSLVIHFKTLLSIPNNQVLMTDDGCSRPREPAPLL